MKGRASQFCLLVNLSYYVAVPLISVALPVHILSLPLHTLAFALSHSDLFACLVVFLPVLFMLSSFPSRSTRYLAVAFPASCMAFLAFLAFVVLSLVFGKGGQGPENLNRRFGPWAWTDKSLYPCPRASRDG